MGLAINYPLFEGRLNFQDSKKVRVDGELRAFWQYIKSLQTKGSLINEFDLASFEFDIGQGLYFESTIPQGFGVGSSGALCASVFDRYGKEQSFDLTKDGIARLKEIFSQLESHFHGSSSGVDPLISYLNTPILLFGQGILKTANIPSYTDGKGGMFLLNTARSRRTEPLVNLFLEKCNTTEFSALCKDELLPITNGCITSFLEGNTDGLFENFKKLSKFQYNNFTPMIPTLYRDIWLQGLEENLFSFKLCGAGGGGFMLGITRDLAQTQLVLSDYEIRSIYSF